MPGQAFLMSGMGASFRPAAACPVMAGPHCASLEQGAFMVADAATADGSASVRVVLWRCQFCGVLLTGIGHPLAGSARDSIDTQEFTWLEECTPLLTGKPVRAAVKEESVTT